MSLVVCRKLVVPKISKTLEKFRHIFLFFWWFWNLIIFVFKSKILRKASETRLPQFTGASTALQYSLLTSFKLEFVVSVLILVILSFILVIFYSRFYIFLLFQHSFWSFQFFLGLLWLLFFVSGTFRICFGLLSS